MLGLHGEFDARVMLVDVGEKWSKSGLLCGQMTNVSSTYRSQREGRYERVWSAVVSKCSMKILAITGERGDPMAAP